MTLFTLSLVLLAAALHAGWNALIKINADRLVSMAILAGSTAVITAFMLPFVAVPIAAAWPYLIVTSFVHLGYMGFLVLAYGHGDYGQVYPIARGAAPLMTTGAAFVIAGEALSTQETAAIILITLSIISLTFSGGPTSLRPVLYALATSVFIATYTMIDALGARASGDVHSYIVWLFFLHGIPLFVLTYFRRRGVLVQSIKENWKFGVIGGAMALVAYWVVLWAVTLNDIGPIATLRETSVLFAAIFSAVWLKEPFGIKRILPALGVAAGIFLLATG